MSSNPRDLVPPSGFIDHVSLTEISGWILESAMRAEFFAEVDGITQRVVPRFHARADLIESNVQGVGFHAYIKIGCANSLLSCYVQGVGAENDQRSYLRFSANSSSAWLVSGEDNGLAVISAKELTEIAAAIEVDSVAYIKFVQKYGAYLAASHGQFDVLFVDGSYGSVSTRYRILNIAAGLKRLGHRTLYARADTAQVGNLAAIRARVVVFFRAPLDEQYKFLVNRFREQGARIVFDVDDLVFDEAIVAAVDGVRYLDDAQVEGYLWGVRHYRKFVLEADLVTCATAYLANYVRTKLGCNAISVRNSIGKAYLKHYTPDRTRHKADSSHFVVGYYSGSKTHQIDFEQAYRGLVKFLRAYSKARFRVVGSLDLTEFPDLDSLVSQVDQIPMMPYHEMLADIANCDVVLAPLVPGDAFCEAKSELKFFEAALLRRPCIASTTSTYSMAIEQGVTGLLANDAGQWFDALSSLYLDPQFGRTLADNARDHSVVAYSYNAAGAEASAAYFGLPAATLGDSASLVERNLSGPRADAGISFAVIIPGIIIGAGGHRKIFRFCRDWAAQGHKITLYIGGSEHPERCRQTIYEHFYKFDCEILTHRGRIGVYDVVVCTHWSTAYSLREYESPGRVIYFVQDFEPLFEAASSSQMRALSTYKMGFRIGSYGKWVSRRLVDELAVNPTEVPFSIHKGPYQPDADKAKVVDILFFARPSQPRRCFELGVEALVKVHRANPAIRIALYGENAYGDLGFAYHNYGLIKSSEELAAIYNRARLGICFSTTNPSLVGYEMMACGLPLLDVRAPKYELNFGGESFVYYADGTPESIYQAIAMALGDEAELARRSVKAMQFVDCMPDDGIIGETLMQMATTILDSRK